MTIHLQSLRSSSSGNSLLLWTDSTMLMIDCGIKAQYVCRDLLDQHVGQSRKLDAVLISHAHSDHICYPALRVLGGHDIPIHCHGGIVDQVQEKHIRGRKSPPRLRQFTERAFCLGDFEVQPIAVNHAPGYLTFAFAIAVGRKRVVIATDLNDASRIAEHLIDADAIFIESNHDLELLRQNWNPASLFHLSNPATAKALAVARKHSRKPPRAVVLGHLSDERNREHLALAAVEDEFARAGMDVDFPLHVAPKYQASPAIRID